MKIFIGTQENCGLIAGLNDGFKALGHEVFTFVKTRDSFFPDAKYDVDLSRRSNSLSNLLSRFNSPLISKIDSRLQQNAKVRNSAKAFKALKDYDLYIYTWDSILPNLEDLKVLKAKGKKIFFLFVGSDARYAKAFKQQFPEVNLPWSAYYINEDLNRKLLFIRTIEKYCDFIFSVPDQSGLLIKPYMHVYLPLKVSEIEFHYPDNEVPVMIHAPSKRSFKGTEVILQCIDKLKSDGLKFEFRLLENIPNHEVKKELLNADVVIDQIYLSGVGMLGTEALAYGCALATKSKSEFGIKFNPPCWYIDDSPDLEDNLRGVIANKDKRKEIAFEGRKYVEKYNEPIAIAKYLENVFINGVSTYDYTPNFFVESFQLESGYELSKKVKDFNRDNLDSFYPLAPNKNSLVERGLVNE